jgi:hypothetical protein
MSRSILITKSGWFCLHSELICVFQIAKIESFMFNVSMTSEEKKRKFCHNLLIENMESSNISITICCLTRKKDNLGLDLFACLIYFF